MAHLFTKTLNLVRLTESEFLSNIRNILNETIRYNELVTDLVERYKYLNQFKEYNKIFNKIKTIPSKVSYEKISTLILAIESDDIDTAIEVGPHALIELSDIAIIGSNIIAYMLENNIIKLSDLSELILNYTIESEEVLIYIVKVLIDNQSLPKEYFTKCLVNTGYLSSNVYPAAYILYNYLSGVIELDLTTNLYSVDMSELQATFSISNNTISGLKPYAEFIVDNLIELNVPGEIYKILLTADYIICNIDLYKKVFDKILELNITISLDYLDRYYDGILEYLDPIYDYILEKIMYVNTELNMTAGLFKKMIFDKPYSLKYIIENTNVIMDLTSIFATYVYDMPKYTNIDEKNLLEKFISFVLENSMFDMGYKLVITEDIITSTIESNRILLINILLSNPKIECQFGDVPDLDTYESNELFYQLVTERNIDIIYPKIMQSIYGLKEPELLEVLRWRIDAITKYDIEFSLSDRFIKQIKSDETNYTAVINFLSENNMFKK